MKKNIAVSVILSMYKEQIDWITQSIESILNQSFNDFEFIIINDNPTSIEHKKLLQEYQKKDSRIKVVYNQKNLGLTKSLNIALSIAKGKYIARMDADDISLSFRFEKQLEYMERYNFDLIYSDTLLIDKNGEEICSSYRPNNVEKVLANLEIHNFIPHPTVLIKKDVFEKYGFYNILFKTGQDLELWLRLRDKIKFGYFNKCLLKYRLNPNSVRPGIYNNYWFKVANYAVWNNHKKIAFKYFNRLSLREKIIILIKIIIPFRIYHRKLK